MAKVKRARGSLYNVYSAVHSAPLPSYECIYVYGVYTYTKINIFHLAHSALVYRSE